MAIAKTHAKTWFREEERELENGGFWFYDRRKIVKVLHLKETTQEVFFCKMLNSHPTNVPLQISLQSKGIKEGISMMIKSMLRLGFSDNYEGDCAAATMLIEMESLCHALGLDFESLAL